jgi:DNA ligase (NAD+)
MTLARYQELVAELAAHDRRYYIDNAPLISDQDYDRLYHELKAIEAAHPDWVVPESPTQRVAPAPVSAFPKIVRDVPMLSLDNTYNPEELQAFLDRVGRGLHDETPAFVVEPKIDGISVELTYQQGRFVLGRHPRRRSDRRGDHQQPAHHSLAAPHAGQGPSTWWCGAKCS